MALFQIAEPGESAAPHEHKLAVGIDQLAFGRADLLAGVDHASFGAHRAGVLTQRPHHVELDFQCGPGLALGHGGEDRTAECGVEQGGGKAAGWGSLPLVGRG